MNTQPSFWQTAARKYIKIFFKFQPRGVKKLIVFKMLVKCNLPDLLWGISQHLHTQAHICVWRQVHTTDDEPLGWKIILGKKNPPNPKNCILSVWVLIIYPYQFGFFVFVGFVYFGRLVFFPPAAWQVSQLDRGARALCTLAWALETQDAQRQTPDSVLVN